MHGTTVGSGITVEVGVAVAVPVGSGVDVFVGVDVGTAVAERVGAAVEIVAVSIGVGLATDGGDTFPAVHTPKIKIAIPARALTHSGIPQAGETGVGAGGSFGGSGGPSKMFKLWRVTAAPR